MTHIQKITTILILGISMLFFTGCFEDTTNPDTASESSSEATDDGSSEAVDSSDDTSDTDKSSTPEATDDSSSEEVEDSSSDYVDDSSSSSVVVESSSSVVDESSSSVTVESSSSVVVVSSSSESALLGGDPLRVPASKTRSWDMLMMGDVKLLLNKWGSDARAEAQDCGSTYEIWAKEDFTFGWTFDRPDCGWNETKGDSPDYPEIEIGVAPFTTADPEEDPLRKSTSILIPIQIKDVTSMNIDIDNFNIEMGADSSSWNINFEMWLSQEDPTLTNTPKPEFELMTFWGWNNNRWGCKIDNGALESKKNLDAGSASYTLCHQHDDWGGDEHSKWDYYQFRQGDAQDGSAVRSFTGTLDVKAALDWLVANTSATEDLWVTRLELGTEIDNNTAGTVSFDNVIFEINGEERQPIFK
ncbi:MAG: hypothetical protein OCC49_09990 [Fibrobacterales bacterium]